MLCPMNVPPFPTSLSVLQQKKKEKQKISTSLNPIFLPFTFLNTVNRLDVKNCIYYQDPTGSNLTGDLCKDNGAVPVKSAPTHLLCF